jgi:hypothetical protein
LLMLFQCSLYSAVRKPNGKRKASKSLGATNIPLGDASQLHPVSGTPSLTVIGCHLWHRHCGDEMFDRVSAHESVRPTQAR